MHVEGNLYPVDVVTITELSAPVAYQDYGTSGPS